MCPHDNLQCLWMWPYWEAGSLHKQWESLRLYNGLNMTPKFIGSCQYKNGVDITYKDTCRNNVGGWRQRLQLWIHKLVMSKFLATEVTRPSVEVIPAWLQLVLHSERIKWIATSVVICHHNSRNLLQTFNMWWPEMGAMFSVSVCPCSGDIWRPSRNF